MENEGATGEKEKEETSHDLFTELFTQEDRKGVDMISGISRDIFEVFDGDGKKISNEEIGEERERECVNIMRRSGSHESNYEYENSGCSGEECGYSRVLLEAQWWS